MGLFDRVKEDIESWIEKSPKYTVVEKREMDETRGGGRLFNITFSDGEKSVLYKAAGYENKDGKCSVALETSIYAGIKDDINEQTNAEGYEIFLNNNGNTQEAAIRVIKQIDDDTKFNMEDAISKVIEYGTRRLMY